MLAANELICIRLSGSLTVFAADVQDPAAHEASLKRTLVEAFDLQASAKLTCSLKRERSAIHFFLSVATGLARDVTSGRPHEAFEQAFAQAAESTLVGPLLSYLHQRAVWLYEKIRLETDFYRYAVQQETAVRELAEKVLEGLSELRVAILGYDAVFPAVLDELALAGCRHFEFFWSDDEVRESLVRRLNATVSSPELQSRASAIADIVLAGKGSPVALLQGQARAAGQGGRKEDEVLLFAFDVSPPQAAAGVLVYTREDLQLVMRHNLEERSGIEARVETWIKDEVRNFYSWVQSEQRFEFEGMISRSPQMQRVFEMISRIAQTDITVLIEGESGTGKELVARAIHRLSSRCEQAFVTVNCGAIPENLLESELFGHVRGAFTGANADNKGLFREADGGTIFLDEIGELAPHLQVKLLRFLQEGEIRPVGAARSVNVKLRVLAATNRNLAQLVADGDFRSDLYYRLNVIELSLPPLRNRPDDIALLAQRFIGKFSARYNKDISGLSIEALDALRAYHWPGNIRELENAMERAVALTIGSSLALHNLPETLSAPSDVGESNGHGGDAMLSLRELERRHILSTLERFEGNHEAASKALGIGRTTLWRKLREYGMGSETSKDVK